MEVDVGGFGTGMSEPEGDGGGVDAGVQQCHCGGVTKGVRSDVFGCEGGAGRGGDGHVFFDQVGDGVAAEVSTGAVGEQWVVRCGVSIGDPALEQPGGGPGQRGEALFAAFAGLCRSVGNAETRLPLTALLGCWLRCAF